MVWAWITMMALASPGQRDLDSVVELVERLHPSPTRHLSEQHWLDAVEQERVRLAGSSDPREVTASISRVLALLGDGHVEVGLPPGLLADPQLFPLQLAWFDGRALVVSAPDDAMVGRELTQVAGVPANDLHEELVALVSVDGQQRVAAEAALRADPWRHLHLVLPQEPTYDVVFADGETRTLPAASREDVGALRRGSRLAPASPQPVLNLRGDVAWWTLPSFGNPDAAAVDASVEDVFSQALPDRLVLDLRGNAGGFRTHGAAIVSHLVDDPFAQWKSASLQLEPVPKRLRKHLSVPYGLPEEETLRLLRTGASERIDTEPLAALFVPREPRYEGQVVVLVDGVTESAAVEMVVGLKAARPEVLVVGEPTGGACDHHNGQRPVLFVTPRLGVPVLMSLVDIDLVPLEGCVPGSGVLPDISVAWTVEAVKSRQDPWEVWVERWAARRD